jgi:hypothetical protein
VASPPSHYNSQIAVDMDSLLITGEPNCAGDQRDKRQLAMLQQLHTRYRLNWAGLTRWSQTST